MPTGRQAMMYPVEGGKVEINPDQIVTAHKEKGGDQWRLYMNDNKEVIVTKHEYAEIRPCLPAGRKLVGATVRLVCTTEAE